MTRHKMTYVRPVSKLHEMNMNNDELQEHFATQAFKQGLRSETDSPRAVKIRSMFKRYLPGGTILDVGCADGALLAPISKQYRVIGWMFPVPCRSWP